MGEPVDVVAGRYRLGRLLGAGGMGEVFEAHHLMTGRAVALKRILARVLMQVPGAELRVLQEAAACGALRHPGIVEILDGGWTDDGDLFLVFELLQGRSLEAAIRERRVAPRDLLRIVVRLLDALSAVHEAGWVHRDIKPGNVFLARDTDSHLRVKLLDFGIAVRSDALTTDEPVVGTLEYMAPEQALGEVVDGRADLWSVGALLYRGLTGRPPWPAKTPSERALTLAESAPPDPSVCRSDLPKDLAAVVRRSLEPSVERRWADAETLASALLAVDEGALGALRPPVGALERSPFSESSESRTTESAVARDVL